MINKTIALLIAGVTAVLSITFLLTNLQTAAADNVPLVLYDGALGGTPDEQLFEYAAANLIFPPQAVQATQTYSAPLTILDTTLEILDYAGYAITPTLAPVLTRTLGFTLNFTIRLDTETHGYNDRAGFSVILLGHDAQGIELAFWEDEIWAQADNPLFTHAEGAAYDTTAVLTNYTLSIHDNAYQLTADSTLILTGTVRDYSAWEPPLPGLDDPYEQPNFIFFGDNTSSAQSETWFAYTSITTNTPQQSDPNSFIYLPVIVKNTGDSD